MKNFTFYTSILLLLIGNSYGYAQKINPYKSWEQRDLSKANTARKFKDISFQEKKVIFYINLARMNGALFVETYLKDYREDVRIPKNKYYRSLVKTLQEQNSLPLLKPREDLFKEAIHHARQMGKTGKKGHRSANHKSFDERMGKLKTKYKRLKENNQYGFPDAISIVIDLLIDDDKESLTHRKTLLHQNLKYIGVGIRPHKKYRLNTTLIFADELIVPN